MRSVLRTLLHRFCGRREGILGSVDHAGQVVYGEFWKDKMQVRRSIPYLVIAGLAGLVACSGPEYGSLRTQAYPDKFKFLQDGQTTRQEVLTRLGKPTHEYEGGRIVTYIVTDSHYANPRV
jgi:hypothetical protein